MVGTDFSTATDDTGYFIMSGVPSGHQRLMFTYNGETSDLDIEVPNDATIVLQEIRCSSRRHASVEQMSVRMNSGGMSGQM